MKKVGLIAGSGKFPLLFAREAKRRGVRVIAAGIIEDANRPIEKLADQCAWFHVGQIGHLIAYFRREGVQEAVMAGRVRHSLLFSPLKYDWRTIKMLASLKDKKANSLLGAVAKELAREGIRLKSSLTYLSAYIPRRGVLTRRSPSPAEWKDIRFGLKMAKIIAGIDVGQTLVVRNQAVVAVEGIEGTDRTIDRAGKLTRGKLVVVKVSKPKQDMRFDVPVIGLTTMAHLRRAKVTAVAIDAGKTLFIDRDQFIREADRVGITVVAV